MNRKQHTPQKVLWLLCVCVCACVSHAYVPVIYPSMIEQQGFIYHEDTRKVMSLPGGVEPLLCRQGEPRPFEEADRDCSDVVIFTSSDSITFQILNLSTNGIIQPFTSRPNVEVSVAALQTRLSAYGSSGSLDVEVIEREESNFLDKDPTEPTTAPSDSLDPDLSELQLISQASASAISEELSLDEERNLEEGIEVEEAEDSDKAPQSLPEEELDPEKLSGNDEAVASRSDEAPPSLQEEELDSDNLLDEDEAVASRSDVAPPSLQEEELGLDNLLDEDEAVASRSEKALPSFQEEELGLDNLSGEEEAVASDSDEALPSLQEEDLDSDNLLDEDEAVASRSDVAPPSLQEEELGLDNLSGEEEAVASDSEEPPPSLQDDGPDLDAGMDIEEPKALESVETPQSDLEIVSDLVEPSESAEESEPSESAEESEPSESAEESEPSEQAEGSRVAEETNPTAAEADIRVIPADPFFDQESEEDSAENNDDEDEFQSLRKLLRELPETITTTGPDSVDISVIEANTTADFLNPNGTIKADRILLMELYVSNIPKNRLIPVTVQFGSNVNRNVFVYREASPVTADINLLPSQSVTSTETHFQYRVDFSNYVFSSPVADEADCADVRSSLSKFSSDYLTSGSDLSANDLRSMRNAARDLSNCFSQPSSSVPQGIVRVTGVSAEIEGRQNLHLEDLQKGQNPRTSVFVSFEANVNRRTRMEISIQQSDSVDLAGQPIEEQSETYNIERRNEATQKSVDRADSFGTASTAMASASVATSVAISVGASVATSVSGSTIVNSAGGMTVFRSMSSAIELLGVCQHIYLTSKMAVPNMPANFEAFGESFSWAMLYIKVPWRENTKEQRLFELSSESELDDKQSGVNIESDIVLFKREWPYERLVLVLFWMLLLFVCLILLHCLLVAIFFSLRLSLHDKLRFPRLELYFLYWVMPAVAGACATLFTGSKNQVGMGIVMLVLIPVAFVVWITYLLMSTFFKKPETYSVFYEVKKHSALTKTSRKADREIVERRTEDCEQRNEEAKRIKVSFIIERYLWTPLLGPPYPCGDWKTIEGPANKFVDRFGPIFEDYRHIPGERRDATLEISADSNRIQRGYFSPFCSAWSPTRVVNMVQVNGAVLRLSRMIFIACFILGQDDPSNNSQGVVLLIVTIGYLLFLRILRPYNERWKLGIALLGEVLRVATYCIVLYLLNNDRTEEQDVRRNLGLVMICFEGLGFFLVFCEQVYKFWRAIKIAATRVLNRSRSPQIIKVIQKAQIRNPRYLERKYFQKWLKFTLGKGIYHGVLMRDKKAPFEELFWIHPLAALSHRLLPYLVGDRKKAHCRNEDL